MRHLTTDEVLELHRLIIAQSGGGSGVRDPGILDSALAQPRMTFGGDELYPTVAEKAAALGLSLVMNHPFVDGNKRIGHAAMETFLVLNGYEIVASADEQERVVLDLAQGHLEREAFTDWLRAHIVDGKEKGTGKEKTTMWVLGRRPRRAASPASPLARLAGDI